MLDSFFFQLGNEMNGSFVFVFCKMAVNAVIADIYESALKPFPAWCIACIKDLVPLFIPGKKFGKLNITIRKIIKTEALEYVRVCEVGLADKF